MSEYDFLETEISSKDSKVLQNLAAMGQRLKELSLDLLDAEIAYREAKTAYEQYRTLTLPAAMFNAGVRDLVLVDGSRLSVNTKVYCSPNKNDADRAVMAEWLRDHGGEGLLKEQCIVDGAFADQLDDVPHTVKSDMNTNSLKAWLKSQLGLDGGTPQFSIEEIPPCMHFTQIDEVSIT